MRKSIVQIGLVPVFTILWGLVLISQAEAGTFWEWFTLQNTSANSQVEAPEGNVTQLKIQTQATGVINQPNLLNLNAREVVFGPSTVVPCEDCQGIGVADDDDDKWGAIFDSKNLLCPSGYVVGGFFMAINDSLPSSGGSRVVWDLNVNCVQPTTLNIADPIPQVWATSFPDGLAMIDPSNLAFRYVGGDRDWTLKDQCSPYSGLATGVFGRRGNYIDSFGFDCGAYSPTPTSLTIYSRSPSKKRTQTNEDEVGGCANGGAPGCGGVPFEVKCPEDQALIGVNIRFEHLVSYRGKALVADAPSYAPLGVESITCAPLMLNRPARDIIR